MIENLRCRVWRSSENPMDHDLLARCLREALLGSGELRSHARIRLAIRGGTQQWLEG